jgi:amidase
MPFDATVRWPSRIGDTAMSSYHRWMEVTTIGTLLNAPVLTVPAGFGPSGLPIGLQVIGRNHDDRALLELARSWHDQRAR